MKKRKKRSFSSVASVIRSYESDFDEMEDNNNVVVVVRRTMHLLLALIPFLFVVAFAILKIRRSPCVLSVIRFVIFRFVFRSSHRRQGRERDREKRAKSINFQREKPNEMSNRVQTFVKSIEDYNRSHPVSAGDGDIEGPFASFPIF